MAINNCQKVPKSDFCIKNQQLESCRFLTAVFTFLFCSFHSYSGLILDFFHFFVFSNFKLEEHFFSLNFALFSEMIPNFILKSFYQDLLTRHNILSLGLESWLLTTLLAIACLPIGKLQLSQHSGAIYQFLVP